MVESRAAAEPHRNGATVRIKATPLRPGMLLTGFYTYALVPALWFSVSAMSVAYRLFESILTLAVPILAKACVEKTPLAGRCVLSFVLVLQPSFVINDTMRARTLV